MPKANELNNTIDQFGHLENQSILILSPSEWGDNAVSNMQIASILSKKNKVAYIETIGGRMPKITEMGRVVKRLQSFIRGHKQPSKRGLDPQNTKIFSPLAIPWHNNRVIDFINKHLVSIQIKKIIKKLGLTNTIIWSFSPRWQAVVENIPHSLFIFHCVDGLHTYDASSKFKALFVKTVKYADLVFTPGILLEEQLKEINLNTYRIGHGCGNQHIQSDNKQLPCEELAQVRKPMAVYAGTLANWVNYDLLINVAKRLPKVSFVLIGYIHALAPRDLVKALLSLPNVFHLGFKNFDDLPYYYSQAAIGLVPYDQNNEHIRYSTPTKFLDYFAAGLPVVSTAFPASLDLANLVDCASNADEFVAAIEKNIFNQGKINTSGRREYAMSSTWNHQIEKMCSSIQHHMDIKIGLSQ